jgi:hypothetical protein
MSRPKTDPVPKWLDTKPSQAEFRMAMKIPGQKTESASFAGETRPSGNAFGGSPMKMLFVK